MALPEVQRGAGKRRLRFLRRWWVAIAAVLLLFVPMLALLGAGLAWLWEHGWFFWWLTGAAVATASAWIALRARHRPFRGTPGDEPGVLTEPDPGWAPHELAAWEEVRRLSRDADVGILKNRTLMLAAAQETIEAVAGHYYPGREDPTLEFTLPELLLLTERVSARVRQLLLKHIPYSHRLKAGHLLRAWGYQPMLSTAFVHGRNVYTILRVIRGVSPMNALVAELRDYVVDDLFVNLQAHLRAKIVKIWIEEVGRAAIELYSGHLRVDAVSLAEAAAGEGLRGAAAGFALPGALRLLVGGQTNAGKSTLVNALLGELRAGVDVKAMTKSFEGYELYQDGAPAAYLIDSPGIEDEAGTDELITRAFACDLILWVVPAHRADRSLDRRAIDALRHRFADNPQRRMPPIVIVASHIDRLDPEDEWAPPYNVDAPTTPKELSIRAAIDAIGSELSVPIESVLPMRLEGPQSYNVDLLRLKLAGLFEDAQRARWIRILRETSSHRNWRKTLRQLAGAGRIVGEFVKR